MQKKYDELCIQKVMGYAGYWSWQEIHWSFQNNIITKKDIIEYAKRILDDDVKDFDLVLEISIAEECEDINSYIEKLMDLEEKQDINYIKGKWRYVILQDLYNNQMKYENIFECVESIYADFDYPEDMMGFIRYMPSNGGQSLEESWKKYLVKSRNEYS